jgi:hypothetical protein
VDEGNKTVFVEAIFHTSENQENGQKDKASAFYSKARE